MNDDTDKMLNGSCDFCHGDILFPESIRGEVNECPICNKKTRFWTTEDVREQKRLEKERKKKEIEEFKQKEDYRRSEEFRQKQLEEEELERIRVRTEESSYPSIVGFLVGVVSIMFLIHGLTMDVSVEKMNNIGLLHDSSNYVMVGCSGLIVSMLCMIRTHLSCIIHNQKVLILVTKDKLTK